MAVNFDPRNIFEGKVKKLMKNKAIAVVIALLPVLFIILLIAIFLAMMSPLLSIFGDGSGTSNLTATQKNVYQKANEGINNLHVVGGTTPDRYLTISSGYYGVSGTYGNTSDTSDEKKYESEITRFIGDITTPGSGLTEYFYFCKDTNTKCGTEESNDCATTCKNGSEKRLYGRTDDEYKAWLVAKDSTGVSPLEKHLKNVNYDLSSNDSEKATQLASAATTIVNSKDLYKEMFNDSSAGNYGFQGGSLTGGENLVFDGTDPLWNEVLYGINNPFSALGDNKQCTSFAYWRFYKCYDFPSGATGNGSQWVDQVVSAHPDKFTISSTPAPGAIFSIPGNGSNPYGHVGYVEKVQGDYMWISDGNVNGTIGNKTISSGIRINNIATIASYDAKGATYAVPINNTKCIGTTNSSGTF